MEDLQLPSGSCRDAGAKLELGWFFRHLGDHPEVFVWGMCQALRIPIMAGWTMRTSCRKPGLRSTHAEVKIMSSRC
jgi:hypothetical protein